MQKKKPKGNRGLTEPPKDANLSDRVKRGYGKGGRDKKKDKRYAGKEERWRDKRDATGCTAQGRIYGWRDDGRGQETERERLRA